MLVTKKLTLTESIRVTSLDYLIQKSKVYETNYQRENREQKRTQTFITKKLLEIGLHLYILF